MAPTNSVTYPEAIDFLYNLRWFGTKLGLENTLKLAALAGNPQERLRFIHVAGTNGKGSTCAMLESIYRAAGLRVGLFTSPHLVAFGERIQVDRHLIAEDEIIRLVAEMQSLLKEYPESAHPTFFEVVTVMALRYFAEQRCDLVVWETGLGGRLDATNIVTPLASLITNIGLDHQQWLGATLTQIAAEKAGIIKPGVPVLTGADAPEALAVITDKARRRGSPLEIISKAEFWRPPLDSLQLPLLGEHQRLNAALAIATVRALNGIIPVSDETLRQGLSCVHWPGRLQWVKTTSGQDILLDGAHNPAGAEALRAALQDHFPGAKPTLIFGVLRDKDWKPICQILTPLTEKILLVPVSSERTADPQDLSAACQAAHPATQVFVCPSLSQALQQTAADPFLLITGSLYLVGEAMELLHLSQQPPANERALNEWSQPGSAQGRHC